MRPPPTPVPKVMPNRFRWPAPASQPVFPQGKEVGVVFQEQRPGQERRKKRHQGAVVQGRQVGGKGDAAFPGENPAGDAQAHASDLHAAGAGFLTADPQILGQGGDQGVPIGHGGRGSLPAGQDLAAGGNQGQTDIGAAQIDAHYRRLFCHQVP